MSVLQLRDVRDTALWKRLATGFDGTQWHSVAQTLAPSLVAVCVEAGDRMKAVPLSMPQYTLHDQVHLLRVTELMSLVLGPVLAELNPVEIGLLLLSAHFHDHGMVLDAAEIEALEKSPEFQLRRSNWIIEHPNFRQIERQRARPGLSEAERTRLAARSLDLERAIITDYIRATHAQRSRAFVKSQHGADQRWTILGTNVADLVGKLCESHGQPATWMTSKTGFFDDAHVGTAAVNLRYLGLILRLADILDLDRDRTPDTLYRAIHFTSDVSVSEWEKHRSVQGWTISPEQIRYTIESTHPAYERTARRFMDWIDEELAAAHAVVRSFPAGIGDKYTLHLPHTVNRDRIGPKDRSYRYHDLEFSLSRDDIVKLLMTDRLYGDPALAVRELLQNSLDALRHRSALHARDGSSWAAGRVVLEHFVNESGSEVVRCSDNGVGMDESIVAQFLTRAGRSFYRSPQFEQERVGFRSANVDFDPCARFGIGFMSCFMLGDSIVVHTRRDNGPNRGRGEPLVVEINGVGGIVVIRDGNEDQPVGTVVEIVGRQKPSFLDEWSDRLRLIRVVDGYALATEYPIEAHCTIPELKRSLVVPPEITVRPTVLERAGVTQVITLRQEFSALDSRLRGEARSSFLLGADGVPCLMNDEASWVPEEEGMRGPELRLTGGGRAKLRQGISSGSTCIDGILVCGTPGRRLTNSEARLGERAQAARIASSHVIDIRGAIKPELTPARTPVERGMYGHPTWRRIQLLMSLAEGRLLEQLSTYLACGVSHATFYELIALSRIGLVQVRTGALWDFLHLPLAGADGEVVLEKLATLGEIEAVQSGRDFELVDAKGRKIIALPQAARWASRSSGEQPTKSLRTLVTLLSTVVLIKGTPKLIPRAPSEPDRAPLEYLMSSALGFSEYPVPFGEGLHAAFAARMAFKCVNRNHPLVALAIAAELSADPSAIEVFARGAVTWVRSSDALRSVTAGGAVPRGLKWLGHAYKQVDWSSVAENLRPPYLVWSEGQMVQVGHEHFVSWAVEEVNDDVDDE